ncbi:MAG: hypothetical protein CM1200mP22_32060 [Dehalococcoidia bacterium]|nr:MAG: hypothetical protein CM1200mP22_32060 [Dehalococcoidia bacterium]
MVGLGLITYMRTDSTQVAESALAEVRSYIQERYGKDHVPAKPKIYTKASKRGLKKRTKPCARLLSWRPSLP